MPIKDVLQAIDEEISKLQQVRDLLSTETPAAQTGKRRGRPKGSTSRAQTKAPEVAGKTEKRKMSAEGKARIAAAQNARWAAQNKAAAPAKKTGKKAAAVEKTLPRKAVAKKPSGKKAPSKKVPTKKPKVQETPAPNLPETFSSTGADGVS